MMPYPLIVTNELSMINYLQSTHNKHPDRDPWTMTSEHSFPLAIADCK